MKKNKKQESLFISNSVNSEICTSESAEIPLSSRRHLQNIQENILERLCSRCWPVTAATVPPMAVAGWRSAARH
jgi:hypothetical protein